MVTSSLYRYLATKRSVLVTDFVDFILGICGRIVSSVFATYILRFLDKFTHKNNRPR